MNGPCKVVILCGGKGIRLRAFAENEPKALVMIGGMPVLWHIMKIYSAYGYRDFVLALGHGSEKIISYFEKYPQRRCDYTLTFAPEKRLTFLSDLPEDEKEWTITFAHTGEDTMTGGRIKRVQPYITGDTFLATYCDGLADIPIPAVIDTHVRSGLDATITAVHPASCFGVVESKNDAVVSFNEKATTSLHVNAGFFVFQSSIFSRISSDADILEESIFRGLVRDHRMGVYHHSSFWHCMDTEKDVLALREMWNSGTAPWKIWD